MTPTYGSSSTPSLLNSFLDSQVGNANPLNLFQKDRSSALEATVNAELKLNSLIDKLDPRKVGTPLAGSSEEKRLVQDTLTDIEQENFRNTIQTMHYNDPESAGLRARQSAALANIAFSTFPTDINSLMGSTLQAVKGVINRFDVGMQNDDPMDASNAQKKRDYNQFISSTVYQYLFKPANATNEGDTLNPNLLTQPWGGLVRAKDMGPQATAAEIRGLEAREAWLNGRVSVSENTNIERIRRIHKDISALSLGFNPYTDPIETERIENRRIMGDRLLTSANNVLNKQGYMSKLGIEPMVNLIYTARTELTMDAFQLQNAAIVEVLIDKLRAEKGRIASGEFKFNLRLAYPGDNPRDLTGMRILGPNLVVLERLRHLMETEVMNDSMSEADKDVVRANFGINYTTANYHTKIYTSDSYAMLGSFNATAPVGNSIRMAGSNYEEVFIFRNYDSQQRPLLGIKYDDKGNPLRDSYGDFVYDEGDLDYIFRDANRMTIEQAAHTKLYRQTRLMQEDPGKFAKAPITEIDRFANIGGAVHAGNALRDAVRLASGNKNNRLFMNLNQVWLLQYSDGLFNGSNVLEGNKGKGGLQSSFSEFGTDYYTSNIGQTDKVKKYRGIQDNLFNLLVNDRAQITVDSHTYEDKVLKPLMSQVKDHLNTQNVDFYSKFDADLGRLGVLTRADQDRFKTAGGGTTLGAIGSLDRKYQALAFNLFGSQIDQATLNFLSKDIYDNITASEQQALAKLGGANVEESLNRLRVLKQIAAVTSGNISLTTQTMQHVKNLAVFDFSNPEGKMIFSHSGSSNYGLSSLDFTDKDGNLLEGGGIKTSNEVSYSLSSKQARDYLGTQDSIEAARSNYSMQLLLQEEEDAMREENEQNYRREWRNLANRKLDAKNNMQHTTKATWESQVKSAKLHQLAEQIETINKTLGYTEGEGIQITKSYGQGKDTARLLSLNIKLNTGALTGAKTANSSIQFRVTAFEDFIYLVNQNKLIGKSLFMNESGRDIFMPYGNNKNSNRLNAGQGTELSDIDTFTNIMVSMAGEMTYRTLIAAPQEFIHRKATAGTLTNAAERMLESMVLGHTTSNSMDTLMHMTGYEIRKLQDSFVAKFGLDAAGNIAAEPAIGRARELMRVNTNNSPQSNKFLRHVVANLTRLATETNMVERRELINDMSKALANAAKATSGENYEVGVAYAMLEAHNDFLYQMKIDKDLKTMKTTFFEPYIARQQASFYANSQTYYRRQVYGVRASNVKMAQSMSLSMNSDEMVGNIAAYWGYARATGYTFSASDDLQGSKGLIRGVAEGGGGRDTGRNTGMSMFGQGQISVADVTGIGLAEDSLVAQYITKEEYVRYVNQLANLFGEGSKAVEHTKQYLQSNEFINKTFKQDDAVILFTFNTPKKRSQIPQRLKNVIGSKPMFELSPELAYLLNKGDDDVLNKRGGGVNAYMDTIVETKTIELMEVYARGENINRINRTTIENFVQGNIEGMEAADIKKLEGFHSKATNTLDPYFSIGMYNAGSIREYLSPEKISIIDKLRDEIQEEHNFSDEDFKENKIGYYLLLTRLKSMDSLTIGRKGFTEGRRNDLDTQGKAMKSVVIVQLTGAYTDYFYSNPFYGVDSALLFGGEEQSVLSKQVYGADSRSSKRGELYGRFDKYKASDRENIVKEVGLLNRIDNLVSTARRDNALRQIYNLIQDVKSPEKYSLATLQTAAAVEHLLRLKFGEKYDKSMASDINLVKEVLSDIATNPVLGLTRNERAGLKSMSAVFERVEKRHKASMLSNSWVNAEGLFLAKKGDVVEFDRHRNKVIVYHQDVESGRQKSEYIVGMDIGIKELATVVDNIVGTADSRNQLSAIRDVIDNSNQDGNAIKVTQTVQGWYRPAEDSKQLTIRAEQLSGYSPDNQLIWEMSFLRAITPSSGRRNEAASGLFKGVEQQTAEGTFYYLKDAGRGLTYMEYINLQMGRQLTGNSKLTIQELYSNQLDWSGYKDGKRQQEVGVWGQDVARLNRIKGLVNPSNLKSYMYEHGIHIIKDQSLRGALLAGGKADTAGDNSGFLAASLLMAFGDSKDGLGNSMLSSLNAEQQRLLQQSFYKKSITGEYGEWFKGIALKSTIKGAKFVEQEIDIIKAALENPNSNNDILTKYGLPNTTPLSALDDPNTKAYGDIRDTILGKKLLSDGKQAHFSNIQNVSLGMMAGGIFETITGVAQEGGGKGLKDMLTALMNSVEQHKDNTFGTVKYNQATTDMATIATAIDIMTQLSISTALVDTPHDINLTDQATVLKLASIMGKKAEELAKAMKPGEEAQWAAIQTLIGAAVNATKMIKMYTSVQFSFSKEGIGKKGTGSLEFQHLLDPLYQFESEFYEKGSINAVRKTIATLYSNLSSMASPSMAYGMVENIEGKSFLDFTSPFESSKMLSLYKSYTDIDSPYMKSAIKLFNNYEKGRYGSEITNPDGTKTQIRDKMNSFTFLSKLADTLVNSTDNAVKEAYSNLVILGPQSLSTRDINILERYVNDTFGNEANIQEYRDVIADVSELQRVFTGLTQMSAYEQMHTEKSFGPEVLKEFLTDYGPTSGTVLSLPGWNTSVNESTGDIILSMNKSETISSYLPSRQEMQLLGAQYGTFVGEVVTKTLDVVQAYTPGTAMYKLRMKMATAGEGGQLSITEEEASMLKRFYESATSIYGEILEATAEGVTQKAMGAKNAFVGAVTTASGSNLVPQRYVVLAQEAMRSALDSNIEVRAKFLTTITDNFETFNRTNGTTTPIGSPPPAASNTQPIENGLDTQKFATSFSTLLKSGVSARFNRLAMAINKMDFDEMNKRGAIDSLYKASDALKDKSEKEFLRQYINMRRQMLTADPEGALERVQQAVTGIFSMGLEGKEIKSSIDLFSDVPKIWNDKNLRGVGLDRADLTNLSYAKERREQENIIKNTIRQYTEDLKLERERYSYDKQTIGGEPKLASDLSGVLDKTSYIGKIKSLEVLLGHLDTIISTGERGGLGASDRAITYEEAKREYLAKEIPLKQKLAELEAKIIKITQKVSNNKSGMTILNNLESHINEVQRMQKELSTLQYTALGQAIKTEGQYEKSLSDYSDKIANIQNRNDEKLNQLSQRLDRLAVASAQITGELNTINSTIKDLNSQGLSSNNLDAHKKHLEKKDEKVIARIGRINEEMVDVYLSTDKQIKKVEDHIDHARATFQHHKNHAMDYFAIDTAQFETIQDAIRSITDNTNFDLNEFTKRDEAGRQHIDLAGIMRLANIGANSGDAREISQVMAFRSSPIGGTAAATNMYRIIQGVGVINQFANDLTKASNSNEGRQYIQLSEERSKALSLLNPIGAITSNLGDWDGDPYTFIFAKASNMANQLIELDKQIQIKQAMLNQIGNSNADPEKIKKNVRKSIAQAQLQRDILAEKIQELNSRLQNQDQIVRKDVANYLGLDIRYFDSVENGGWANETVATDVMYTYIEQGRGLFGGLEGQVEATKSFQSGLTNLIDRDTFDTQLSPKLGSFSPIEKQLATADALSNVRHILETRAAVLQTDTANHGNLSAMERLLVNLDSTDSMRSEFLDHLASNIVATMQEPNQFGETFENFNARLYTVMGLDNQALAAANKLISQGSGTHMTETGFSIMNRVMGKAGSDILGKTYNTLVGAMYSSAPELAMAGIFENKEFQKAIVKYHSSEADLTTDKLNQTVQILSRAREQSAATLGFIKNINQLLRDGIKPKTPGAGEADSIAELEKAVDDMRSADPAAKQDLMNKINIAADNLGPGQGIGLRALTQLNSLINATDGIMTEQELASRYLGDEVPDTQGKMNTLFAIDATNPNDAFTKVLADYQQRIGTEQISNQSAAALKTSMDLRALIVQYRYSFLDDTAKGSTASNIDTLFNKLLSTAEIAAPLVKPDNLGRANIVNRHVDVFFQDSRNLYTLKQSLSPSEFTELTTRQTDPQLESARQERLRTYYSIISEVQEQTQTFMGKDGEKLLQYSSVERLRQRTVANLNNAEAGNNLEGMGNEGAMFGTISNLALGGKLTPESLNTMMETLVADANLILGGEGKTTNSSIDVIIANLEQSTPGFSSLSPEDKATVVNTLKAINKNDNLKKVFAESMETSAAELKANMEAQLINEFNRTIDGDKPSLEMTENMQKVLQSQQVSSMHNRTKQVAGIVETAIVTNYSNQVKNAQLNSQSAALELLMGVGLAGLGALFQEGSMEEEDLRSIAGSTLVTYAYMKPALATINKVGDRVNNTASRAAAKGKAGLSTMFGAGATSAIMLGRGITAAAVTGQDEDIGASFMREMLAVTASTAFGAALNTDLAGVISESRQGLMMKREQQGRLNRLDSAQLKTLQVLEAGKNLADKMNPFAISPITYDDNAGARAVADGVKGAMVSAAVGVILGRLTTRAKINYQAMYNERIDSVLANAEEGLANSVSQQAKAQQESVIGSAIYYTETGEPVQMAYDVLEEYEINTEVDRVRYDGWGVDEFLTRFG